MQAEETSGNAEIWRLLEDVKDPEIPVLSVLDMGMITDVFTDEKKVVVKFTPTFIGCPAINVIQKNIESHLKTNGIENIIVEIDLNTTWTSERMTEKGREKLEKFGIAPPAHLIGEVSKEYLDKVRCPHCGSTDTTLNSPFGSTLCRAIRFCFSCKQGFEQFKPI